MSIVYPLMCMAKSPRMSRKISSKESLSHWYHSIARIASILQCDISQELIIKVGAPFPLIYISIANSTRDQTDHPNAKILSSTSLANDISGPIPPRFIKHVDASTKRFMRLLPHRLLQSSKQKQKRKSIALKTQFLVNKGLYKIYIAPPFGKHILQIKSLLYYSMKANFNFNPH